MEHAMYCNSCGLQGKLFVTNCHHILCENCVDKHHCIDCQNFFERQELCATLPLPYRCLFQPIDKLFTIMDASLKFRKKQIEIFHSNRMKLMANANEYREVRQKMAAYTEKIQQKLEAVKQNIQQIQAKTDALEAHAHTISLNRNRSLSKSADLRRNVLERQLFGESSQSPRENSSSGYKSEDRTSYMSKIPKWKF